MVVGEPQILGQVKESYTVAKQVGAVANSLDRLLQSAFTVAKKVRSETEIGSSSVSIASVAVDLARKIFGSLAGRNVLLVGAGKMSELAVRHLVQHGATSLLLANRTPERAARLAQTFASPRVHTVETIPFDSLAAEAHRADIVITSTGALATGGTALFTPEHGRAISSTAAAAAPCSSSTSPSPATSTPASTPSKAASSTTSTTSSRSPPPTSPAAFRKRSSPNPSSPPRSSATSSASNRSTPSPAIKALQEQAEQTRQTELTRSAKALATLTPAQAAAVESLTRALTAKLLHPQLVALRDPKPE